MDNQLKSKTRLAFIQYIFLSMSSHDDKSVIKNDFNNYFHNLTVSAIDEKKNTKIQYNKNMFNKLTDNYIDFIKSNDLSLLIDPHINFERKFNQWSKINQSIILAIISEIIIISKDKIKIVLNDYLNIAKRFVTTKELKMLNAIIDKYLNEKKYI
tara:strand:+ start:517 stop:981 length:465 start_codon:yes stop_codon:yes gene_type:complete